MNEDDPGFNSRAKQKMIAGVVVVALIAVIIMVVDHMKSGGGDNADTQATTQTGQSAQSSQQQSTADNTSSTAAYKDGTYTASSTYYVEHGSENIKVTLTVANGTVTDSSIVNSEYDHDSRPFQEEFAAEYKSYVVGKPLSTLDLPVVAGASDTTDGFNQAVNQIREQAQA